MKNFLNIIKILLIFFLILPSCIINNNVNNEKSNNKITLYATTKALDNTTTQYLSSVSEDGSIYTFSNNTSILSTLLPGDVIVSGPTSLAPYGFLRKVVSVSNGSSTNFKSSDKNDNTVIATTQATIEDAIKECNVKYSIKLNIGDKKSYFNEKPINMKIKYLSKGVSIQGNSIILSGTELFSGDVGATHLTALISNGSICFEPTFNKELEISLTSPHIKKLSLSAKGTINFDCDLQLVCNGAISYSKEIPIIPLGIFGFGPIMIGPVPIFIDLTFNAGFETELEFTGTFQTGFNTNASVEFGAKYYQSQWSPIWEKNASFTQHPIIWSYDNNAFARAYVSPQLSITIAGVAGTYLEVEPYLEFNGVTQSNNWQWELAGGLDSNIGFSVSIFGNTIADYNTTLLNWEKTISSNSGTNTNVSLLVNTFGTGDSYSPNSGWTLGYDNGDSWVQAIGFTPEISGTVLQYEIAVLKKNGGFLLDAWLCSDSNNQPGFIIEKFSFIVPSGLNDLRLSASSSINPLLITGTQYWLVVAPPDITTESFAWYRNPSINGVLNAQGHSPFGPWNVMSNEYAPTLKITGNIH